MKDIIYFCIAAVFYDYTNIGIVCELNQVRKCIIKIFLKQYHIQEFLSVYLYSMI